MIIYWENWKGLCQKEGKNYMLWSHLVAYPPFKLQDLYVSTCALRYSFLTLRYIQSTVLQTLTAAALSHPSPSNPLDSNTHSPQSFISFSSAVYGVMLKTQNNGMFQLGKKKKKVFCFSSFVVVVVFWFFVFSLKIRFVAFTEELSKQLQPSARIGNQC